MNRWTNEEVKLLKENYNKISNNKLAELFPTKSFTAIYKKAYAIGLRKTKENNFLNRSEARKGEKGSNWKGGKKRTKKGYIQVLMPNHPRADLHGYVLQHIVIFEEKTGITIPNNCCIHHLNGKKDDNRVENLCLMETGAHSTFHNLQRKAAKQNE